MSNLIDSSLLWYSQLPLRVHRILLQEKSAAKKFEITQAQRAKRNTHILSPDVKKYSSPT